MILELVNDRIFKSFVESATRKYVIFRRTRSERRYYVDLSGIPTQIRALYKQLSGVPLIIS